ncbi:MAG: LysR family transcriptional regulator [Synergistaceae bacterium]|nr:LysR family transcriptional regulator [Synergistaceae bacterium]
MDLNLREIQYLLAVCEEGTMTQAARLLHIAQPSLSQSIQKIEQSLGVQLFSRANKKKIKLTYAGERFMESATKIIKISRDLENELQDISALNSGRIILGITLYLGSYLFAQIKRIYEGIHPGVVINLIEKSSSDLENLVINGMADVAIMPIMNKPCSTEYETLFKARIILLIPLGHWMEKHIYYKEGCQFPFVDIRLAKNEAFLSGKKGQRIREVTEYVFQKAEISPPIIFESRSIETIKRLSAAGTGLAFMPDYYHDFIRIPQDVTYCYIEDEFNPDWKVAMLYQSQTDMSATVREFMRVIKKELARPSAI